MGRKRKKWTDRLRWEIQLFLIKRTVIFPLPLSTYYFPTCVCGCVQAFPRLIQERDHLKVELERMREEKHQARELIQRAREEKSKAREEEERLREERDKAKEESRRAREDKERLESKLALLQERCDRLSRRVRYSLLTQDISQTASK